MNEDDDDDEDDDFMMDETSVSASTVPPLSALPVYISGHSQSHNHDMLEGPVAGNAYTYTNICVREGLDSKGGERGLVRSLLLLLTT